MESNIQTTTKKVPVYKYKKKMKPGERRKAWLSRIFLWVVIIITLFPLVAVVSASMAKGQTFTQASIFPQHWTFENYAKVFEKTKFLTWVKNSMIVCTSVAVIQLCLAVPAAFAFSKMKFVGRKSGLMTLLILQMFPAAMALPAILAVAYRFGFMDHLWGLILLQSGASAFNIWLLKGYMDGIPKELSEAAYVDGASTWQMFTRIILPLMRNMLIVIFLFGFIGAYSEFMLTACLMKNPLNQTVATGMKTFITGNFSANWTQYSAAAIMASLPLVIIFLCGQKYIAQGVTAGSVKG